MSPSAKNGDLAFLLHLVASLNSTGKDAMIMPHGVLLRGNREADIRRNLVKRGLIKGVIGLPANLFYGTGIPACIVVIDKENAVGRRDIFMIHASKGFQKDGAKNAAGARHPPHRGCLHGAERCSRLFVHGAAGRDRQRGQRLHLNITRYIDSSEPEDLHALGASVRVRHSATAFSDFLGPRRRGLYAVGRGAAYGSLPEIG